MSCSSQIRMGARGDSTPQMNTCYVKRLKGRSKPQLMTFSREDGVLIVKNGRNHMTIDMSKCAVIREGKYERYQDKSLGVEVTISNLSIPMSCDSPEQSRNVLLSLNPCGDMSYDVSPVQSQTFENGSYVIFGKEPESNYSATGFALLYE